LPYSFLKVKLLIPLGLETLYIMGTFSKLSATLFFCYLTISFNAFSQSFSSVYDFNGVNCASNAVTAQPSNGTFSTVSLTNINCASGNGSTLNTQNWTTASSVDLGTYIEFTITTSSGFRVGINSLSFKMANSTSGPTSVDIAHNASGSFSSSTTFTGINTSYSTYTWNPSITYKSTPVTFRIYGYNASVVAGAKQLKIDNITINGFIAPIPTPTIQSSISIATRAATSIDLTFSGGNGAKRIVLAKAVSAVDATPVDQVDYTANAAFGSGSQIGSGNYTIYNGSGNSVTVTGLTTFTTYHFAVFEYNDDGIPNSSNYLTINPGRTSAVASSPGTYAWTGSINTAWNNSGNWTPTRSTLATTDILVFNKGGAVSITSIPNQTIGQLVINNSTAVTLAPSATRTITISGASGTDVDVASGSSLTLGTVSSLILSLNTSTTLVANGNIIVSNLASQIAGSGSITINGTFSTSNVNGFSGASNTSISNTVASVTLGTSSIVNYTGTAQTVSTSSNYANLTLSGSGTKTISANLTTLGDLTLSSSAVLNPQTFNVTVGGNWTSYDATAFSESTGKVTFNGTTAQIITTTGGETFNTLEIASSGGVTLASTTTIANLLTLSSGVLTANGNLQLDLDVAKVNGANGSINGSITIYKNVASVGTHYLGIPLGGVDANQINDDTPVINPITGKTRLYSYVGPNYAGITNLSTTLTPFTGYTMYFTAGSVSLDYTGTYNHTATYSSNFSNTTSAFQLVGNPYLSALDWNASSGWTKTNFNDALYIWNASTNSYASYVGGSGSNGGTQYIPSLQGFFVETNGGGGTATIGVTNDVCSIVSNPSMLRVANTATSSISITVTGTNCSDEAKINLSDDASADFDQGLDASKMFNPGTTPSIYTISNGRQYAINTVSNDDAIVPLAISFPVSGFYNVLFAVPSSTTNQFALVDTKTGSEQVITDGQKISLSADDNSTETRYALRVGNNTSSTALNTTSGSIYSYDKTIYIANFTGEVSQITVNDIVGNTVLVPTTVNSTMTIDGSALKTGLYIVNVIVDGKMTSNKVIIK
jgi:hypothetical protein